MTFNQQLIEKARKGEIAILNDGTKEQLFEVLAVCCPQYRGNPSGTSYVYEVRNGKWFAIGVPNESALPAHSVKDFFMTDTEIPGSISMNADDLIGNLETKPQPRTYKVTRRQMKEIHDSIEKPSHQVVIDLLMKDNFPTYENEAIFSDGHVSMLKSVSVDIDVLKKIFPEYFFIPEGEPVLCRDSDDEEWVIRISTGQGDVYNMGYISKREGLEMYKQIITFTKTPPK